jgi:glutamate racemase
MGPVQAPIGVFDSGIGGLTVVAALRRELPDETLLYLGDTARVPYGTKSPEVVQRYAFACSRFLVEKGAKLVVVACNTATAHALGALEAQLSVPVVGVIQPGAALAASRSQRRSIGVIATEGTVHSGSYQAALATLAPGASVHLQPCPLFVPLAEEGLGAHPAAKLLAVDYLTPLMRAGIDTLVLGCTHYPMLAGLIREVVGPNVDIIDSASAVARATRLLLDAKHLRAKQKPGPDRFFATDVGQRFARVGRTFLGGAIDTVEHVDL